MDYNNFGYMQTGDNVRRTPANVYDTVTMASGTLTYKLFSSDTVNGTDRNLKLPLSSSEVLFINDISATLTSASADALSTTSFQEFLTRTYLRVVVNGSEKMKIPMFEIFNYYNTTKLGSSAYWYQTVNSAERSKKLRNWLIVADSQAVDVFLVTTTNGATGLNGQTIRFNFQGVKQNKLYSFNQSFVDQYSTNNYTVYDTVTASTSATTYNLFASQRADTDYSITLDRYDAIFEIQALEVFYSIGNARKEAAIAALKSSFLKMNINGVEVLNTDLQHCLSVNGYYSGTFNDVTPVLTSASQYYDEKNILVLQEPIVVPANSPVSTVLSQPAYNGANGYLTACLYGELTRKVS